MSTPRRVVMTRLLALAALLPAASCGVIGPSCTDEDNTFLQTEGRVAAGSTTGHSVTSPKNSNLQMHLTWPDGAATLGLRATITSCGDHVGCTMSTRTADLGPGGEIAPPSRVGERQLTVDGTRGKTYRVEIVGDAQRDAAFSLKVNTHIRCER